MTLDKYEATRPNAFGKDLKDNPVTMLDDYADYNLEQLADLTGLDEKQKEDILALKLSTQSQSDMVQTLINLVKAERTDEFDQTFNDTAKDYKKAVKKGKQLIEKIRQRQEKAEECHKDMKDKAIEVKEKSRRLSGRTPSGSLSCKGFRS